MTLEDGYDEQRERAPQWACDQWGTWEHDWLDCVECRNAYADYQRAQEELFDLNDMRGTGPVEVQGIGRARFESWYSALEEE